MFKLVIVILIIICLILIFVQPIEAYGNVNKISKGDKNELNYEKKYKNDTYVPPWYYPFPYYIGDYWYDELLYKCNSCDNKDEDACSKCQNCGYCVRNGVGKCLEGSMSGPYEGRDCDEYWFSKS